jgi:hypothetical protein
MDLFTATQKNDESNPKRSKDIGAKLLGLLGQLDLTENLTQCR